MSINILMSLKMNDRFLVLVGMFSNTFRYRPGENFNQILSKTILVDMKRHKKTEIYKIKTVVSE